MIASKGLAWPVVVVLVVIVSVVSVASWFAGSTYGYALGVQQTPTAPAEPDVIDERDTIRWASCERWLLQLAENGMSREDASTVYGHRAAGGPGVAATEFKLYAEIVWDDLVARGLIQ